MPVATVRMFGIEDDVGRRKADLLGQQSIGPAADAHLVFDRDGLALLVERHHDRRGPVAAHQPGVVQKDLFPFLEADRVDDRLALHAFQARLDDRPFRAIDHDRHTRHLRLRGDEVEKPRHGRFAVEQGLVHVDVDDVRSGLDLLAGDGDRFLKLVGEHELGESLRAGHVCPLADHDEIALGADRERLEAAEAGERLGLRRLARRFAFDRRGDRANVRRRRPATAADDVQPAPLGELAERAGHHFGRFVEPTEGVRQAGIRIAAQIDRRDAR